MKFIEKYNENILKIWLIQSGVVCLILYIVSLIISETATLFSGICLFILIVPNYMIHLIVLTILKNNKQSAFKVIGVLEFIYVYLIQLIICGFITVVISSLETIKIDSVRLYKPSLRQIKCKECVQHFPKHIPSAAKHVKFHKSRNPFFGSIDVMLSFETDKQYIDNELTKYKIIKIEGPFDDNQQYDYSVHYLAVCRDDIPIQGTKNYIIKSSSFDKEKQFHGPYAYGILVDEINNRIIYYYIVPD